MMSRSPFPFPADNLIVLPRSLVSHAYLKVDLQSVHSTLAHSFGASLPNTNRSMMFPTLDDPIVFIGGRCFNICSVAIFSNSRRPLDFFDTDNINWMSSMLQPEEIPRCCKSSPRFSCSNSLEPFVFNSSDLTDLTSYWD